jgi:hypothetical protein
MNKTLRIAIVAFVVAAIVSFVVSFSLTASGSSGGAAAGQVVALLVGGLIAVVAYLRWNLSGNRKIAEADAGQRERAMAFAPGEGQAAIYFIRTGFVAKAAGMNISIDGRDVAQLKSPQFTCVAVSPGAHEIGMALAGGAGAQSQANTTSVTLEPGGVVSLLFNIKMGGLKNMIAVETLAIDRARTMVATMKMVAPTGVEHG